MSDAVHVHVQTAFLQVSATSAELDILCYIEYLITSNLSCH